MPKYTEKNFDLPHAPVMPQYLYDFMASIPQLARIDDLLENYAGDEAFDLIDVVEDSVGDFLDGIISAPEANAMKGPAWDRLTEIVTSYSDLPKNENDYISLKAIYNYVHSLDDIMQGIMSADQNSEVSLDHWAHKFYGSTATIRKEFELYSQLIESCIEDLEMSNPTRGKELAAQYRKMMRGYKIELADEEDLLGV